MITTCLLYGSHIFTNTTLLKVVPLLQDEHKVGMVQRKNAYIAFTPQTTKIEELLSSLPLLSH